MRGSGRFVRPSSEWTEPRSNLRVCPSDGPPLARLLDQGQNVRQNPHKIQLFLHPRPATTHAAPLFGLRVGEEAGEVDLYV